MSVYIHPAALVESQHVGAGSRIWAFAHVLPDARIGRNCNIGDYAYIETGARLGDNVTVKNHVCIWEGIEIHDAVFIGPHVSFINDRYPRSPRMEEVRRRYEDKGQWLLRTVVEQGGSIGANATIMGGLRLGHYALIAAGSVVTKDVPPHALMAGAPARRVGTVCVCGKRIPEPALSLECSQCAGGESATGNAIVA